MYWAHHAVRGEIIKALQGLYLTIFLGGIFTLLQIYEYNMQHLVY